MSERFCIFDVFSRLPRSDEDYALQLRVRMKLWFALSALGLVTWVVMLAVAVLGWSQPGSHALNFYSGAGMGLFGGCLYQALSARRTLRDPEKLHRRRVAAGDERRVEISRRALLMAGLALLAAVYLVGLIGVFFWPEAAMLLLALIMVFVLTYLIAFWALNRTM